MTQNATVNEIITISGVNGECSQSLGIQITVMPKPSIEIVASETSINTGAGIQFEVGSSNASSYSWNFGDGTTSNFSLPYHNFIFAGAYNVILTGNTGICENSDTLLVYVGTTDIESNNNQTFSIFPNPVRNNLYISSTNDTQFKLELKNIQGKTIFKSSEENVRTVEISLIDYKKGIYILNINSNGQQFSKKIIKL